MSRGIGARQRWVLEALRRLAEVEEWPRHVPPRLVARDGTTWVPRAAIGPNALRSLSGANAVSNALRSLERRGLVRRWTSSRGRRFVALKSEGPEPTAK